MSWGGISIYLLAPLVAWIVAQGTKYIINTAKNRSIRNYRQLYISGGMPSAHSATVIALMTVVGLMEGTSSAIFGVTVLFAAIVMYDAMMVRHSSGTQGAAIVALITEQDSKVPFPRVAKGHTPIEVAAGALVGFIVAIVVFLATK